MKRAGNAILAASISLTLLASCASSTESKALGPLTIDRLLMESLTGIAGRDHVRAELAQAYGIAAPAEKYINKESRTLADQHVLSMLRIEPLPADFIAVAVSGEPCFQTERALRLTQAKPHSETPSAGAQTYDAFRNGTLVSFSTTPDQKCVSSIHIGKDSLTIERILTEPLTGVEGRDRVRGALAKAYGIDPSITKYTNREPRVLADRHVVSLFWLEPPPANFISLSVNSDPCFSTQHAVALTQAAPYSGSGETSYPAYNAIKNGMLVGFTSTPDGKCVKGIHIEEDK